MTQKAQQSTGDGNTNSSPSHIKNTTTSKSKVGFRARNYFFTYNNYDDTEITEFENYFATAKSYVFQEEKGENGTEHLQGVVCFQTAKQFSTLKKWKPKVHWEKCRSVKHAQAYCSKVDSRNGKTYSMGFKIKKALKDPLAGKKLFTFQKEILEIIKTEPDDRTIHWYWEPTGCIGKTALAKHICMNHNAIYVQGKATDVKFGVSKYIEEEKELDVVIMGLPRSYEQFVSYDAIESIKDGIFYNSKYESGMVMFNPPHLFILANFAPDTSKLSLDRWNVHYIPPHSVG